MLRRRLYRAAAVLALLLLVAATSRLWPKPALSEHISSSVALYSADGRLLRLTTSSDDKYRLWVPLEKISPQLVDAVLLHEDRWFRWHFGVNPWSVSRGAWKTYVGGNRQGGSTISMQLARLMYRLNTRTPTGKFAQSLRALQLEFSYSKHDILEAYLNLVPFSQNIEGIAAASLIYFRKPPGQLTLPEALTLAVIPQSPARREPARNAAALTDARAQLFASWRRSRPTTAGDADLMSLPIKLKGLVDLPFLAPHLADMLLAQHRREQEIGTTLDLPLQRTLERQVQQYVTRGRRVGIENGVAMVVDSRDMEVKALVGSADFFNAKIHGQVNGVLAKRSPGSTLKPFLYALAMDQGLIHPMSVLKDAPTAFGPYSPENFDGNFVGPITAQDALIRSRNVPAVALAARLSNPNLYDFLRGAGISELRSENFYGLGLVLGGAEVTMEELAGLYAMLANRGVLEPLRYRRSDQRRPAVRLLSEEASFMTLDMLRHNPRPDLAYAAQGSRLPVYWKTGTSWGFRDAWTAGIFGPYVIVVWVGNFDGEGNPVLVGIQAAAPLFFHVVDAIRALQPDLYEPAWHAPPNLARVEVCSASGELPNVHCPQRTTTWFIPGKSPIRVSTIHRPVTIDKRTGLQACPPYDPRTTREEVFEFWPADMLRLFERAGLPRRAPPPFAPGCKATEFAQAGAAPQILRPLRGATYTLRLKNQTAESVPLLASTDADAQGVYWFVNESFVGTARPGSTLLWQPKTSGKFVVRAVDDRGRADARDLAVEVVQ